MQQPSTFVARAVFCLLLLACAAPSRAQDRTPPPLPTPPDAPGNPTSLAERCQREDFSTLFTCTFIDVRHLARRDSLVWLGVGGAVSAGSLPVDHRVANALEDPDRGVPVEIGDHLGEAGLQFGAPALMYAVARAAGRPEMGHLSIALLRAQVVNGIVTRSLKFFPRARPYQEHARPGRGSFPSGHASGAFATATVLHDRFGWRAGVPAYAVAGFIGATRLQNMHYLSDVAFGAGLGIASGLAVKVSPGRTAVTPIVGPGVAGVSVSITRNASR